MEAHQSDPIEQYGWSELTQTNGSTQPKSPDRDASRAGIEPTKDGDVQISTNDAKDISKNVQDISQGADGNRVEKAADRDNSKADTQPDSSASLQQPANTVAVTKPPIVMTVTTPSGMRITVRRGARLDFQDGYILELAPGVPFTFRRRFFGSANMKIVFGKHPQDASAGEGSSNSNASREGKGAQKAQHWTFTDLNGVKYTVPIDQKLNLGLFDKGGSIMAPPGSVFFFGEKEAFERAWEEAKKAKREKDEKKAQNNSEKPSAVASRGDNQGGSRIKGGMKKVLGLFQASETPAAKTSGSGYDSDTTLS